MRLLIVLASLLSFSVIATENPNVPKKLSAVTETGYLARIQLNSSDEVHNALKRAELLFLQGHLEGKIPPVRFVLHGPEVAIFFQDNYLKHKELLDLAARLSAFNVLEIQVCETQMGVMGRESSGLLPFVGTVPFGPAEADRLLKKEKYVYF